MADNSVGRSRSESRDPTLEELRERVSDRFRSVGATAGALQAKVRDASDLRGVARRHPGWVVGAAAGAGLLAATMVRRRRRRRAEQKVEAALGWVSRFPFGPRLQQPRSLAGVGGPVVKGALSLVASLLVRRFGRQLQDELRSQLHPRPRIVPARSETA